MIFYDNRQNTRPKRTRRVMMPHPKGAPIQYKEVEFTPEEIKRAEKLQRKDNAFFKNMKMSRQSGLSRESQLNDAVAKQQNAVKFDVNSAVKKQEEDEQQQHKEALHNVKILLNSLETISAGYSLFSKPWLFLAKRRLPSTLLQRAGDYAANKGLVSRTTAQMPSLYMNAYEKNSIYPLSKLDKVNSVLGGFIDGMQIPFSDNNTDRIINGAELSTLAFPNTPFKQFLQFGMNGYDFYHGFTTTE